VFLYFFSTVIFLIYPANQKNMVHQVITICSKKLQSETNRQGFWEGIVTFRPTTFRPEWRNIPAAFILKLCHLVASTPPMYERRSAE
jgi:hypothetical protein